jgi:uncharacterized protein (TIGR02147 family)
VKITNIDIFTYDDYRDYLKACFEWIKDQRPDFSYAKWAKEMGMSSVSGLTMVLSGQRNAGPSIRKKISSYLELNEKEQDQFKKMVDIQKRVKNDSQLVLYMLNSDDDSSLSHANRPIQFKWEMGLIREATKINDFKASMQNVDKICRYLTPGVDFKSVYQEMIAEGMLVNESDQYRINKQYRPKEKIDTRYFKLLHHDFLDMMKQSYEVSFDKRALEYRLMIIKKNKVEEAKRRIQEFLNDFAAEFEVADADKKDCDIYLTALNFIPMTKDEESK